MYSSYDSANKATSCCPYKYEIWMPKWDYEIHSLSWLIQMDKVSKYSKREFSKVFFRNSEFNIFIIFMFIMHPYRIRVIISSSCCLKSISILLTCNHKFPANYDWSPYEGYWIEHCYVLRWRSPVMNDYS